MFVIQLYFLSPNGSHVRDNLFFADVMSCAKASEALHEALNRTPLQQHSKTVADRVVSLDTVIGVVRIRPSVIIGYHAGSLEQATAFKTAVDTYNEIFKDSKFGFGS